MPDVVGRGIAHAEIIGSATLSEPQRVDGRLGKFRQGRVRKGARVPLGVKGGIWFRTTRLPTQCMRERKVPASRRDGSGRLAVVKIAILRQRQRPCLSVVLLGRMRLGVFLDERNRSISA